MKRIAISGGFPTMSLIMRILIVEDERKTADYLKKGLSESSFVVDAVHNGDDGVHLALNEYYDLIVLDVMLPGRDGYSVLGTFGAREDRLRCFFLPLVTPWPIACRDWNSVLTII